MGRHAQRVGAREVDRQGEQDHHHQRQVAPLQGGRREDDGRRGEVRKGGRGVQGEGGGEERARELLLLDEEHARGRQGQGQDLGGGQEEGPRRRRGGAQVARGQPARREGGVLAQAEGGRGHLLARTLRRWTERRRWRGRNILLREPGRGAQRRCICTATASELVCEHAHLRSYLVCDCCIIKKHLIIK